MSNKMSESVAVSLQSSAAFATGLLSYCTAKYLRFGSDHTVLGIDG